MLKGMKEDNMSNTENKIEVIAGIIDNPIKRLIEQSKRRMGLPSKLIDPSKTASPGKVGNPSCETSNLKDKLSSGT